MGARYLAFGIPGRWSHVAEVEIGGRTTVLPTTAMTTPAAPDFHWQAVTGAIRYILRVSDENGNVVLRLNNLTDTTYTPAEPLAASNYRVWVKAIDSSNSFAKGYWSRRTDFTVTDAETTSSLDPSVIDAFMTNIQESFFV